MVQGRRRLNRFKRLCTLWPLRCGLMRLCGLGRSAAKCGDTCLSAGVIMRWRDIPPGTPRRGLPNCCTPVAGDIRDARGRSDAPGHPLHARVGRSDGALWHSRWPTRSHPGLPNVLGQDPTGPFLCYSRFSSIKRIAPRICSMASLRKWMSST